MRKNWKIRLEFNCMPVLLVFKDKTVLPYFWNVPCIQKRTCLVNLIISSLSKISGIGVLRQKLAKFVKN